MNPLIPEALDVVLACAAMVVFAATVVAFVSWARRARTLPPLAAVAWFAIILFVPVLGAIGWLSANGRSRTPATR